MKKLILVAIIIAFSASLACAISWHNSIQKTSFTKLKQTITGVNGAIEYVAVGTNCRLFINASSAHSVPLISGTRYDANVSPEVSAFVFKCNSAAVGVNSIHIIK